MEKKERERSEAVLYKRVKINERGVGINRCSWKMYSYT